MINFYKYYAPFFCTCQVQCREQSAEGKELSELRKRGDFCETANRRIGETVLFSSLYSTELAAVYVFCTIVAVFV